MPRTFRYLSINLLGLAALTFASCSSSETTVGMDELPGAVRTTLERETAGGTIKEIEKESKDGKTVYSADAELNGKVWDIVIAEDGTVVSKELD